jgi:hypothetical protein
VRPLCRHRLDGRRGVIRLDISGTPACRTAWKNARPRARSPQGDGEPCLSPAATQRSPDAGEDARAPRGRSAPVHGRRLIEPATTGPQANPRPGEALVPERGARRATGDHAPHQPPRNGPRMRARTPALPGEDRHRCMVAGSSSQQPLDAKPIPGLERRSSPSAEPAGRRGIMPHTSLRTARPGCGRGRPRSQGKIGTGAWPQAHRAGDYWPPSQSQTWRGARPRARSPQGDGGSCPTPASVQRAPDAGEDARAPGG